MGQRARGGAVAFGIAVLVLGGCSARQSRSSAGSSPSSTATATTAPADAVTAIGPTSSAASAATSTPSPSSTFAATAPPTSSTGTTTSTGPAGVVAEAGGWRLAVSQPTAGGTIGLRTVVCYAISGSAREPELVLEVTLLLPQGLATSVPVSVGRGAATVDLGSAGAPPGRYNLRFQLIVNGERLEGLAVTIPSVTISAGTAPGSCA